MSAEGKIDDEHAEIVDTALLMSFMHRQELSLAIVFLLTMEACYAADYSPQATESLKANKQSKLIELKQYKQTEFLNLEVGQARLFKIEHQFVRTSIADPAVAEPVVLSESQLVIVGKAAGRTTLGLWDSAGNFVDIGLCVRSADKLTQLKQDIAGPLYHVLCGDPAESKIPALKTESLEIQKVTSRWVAPTSEKQPLEEQKPAPQSVPPDGNSYVSIDRPGHRVKTRGISGTDESRKVDASISIEVSEAKTYRANSQIERLWVSNVNIAEPVVVQANEIVIFGKTSGRTVLGFADESGKKIGIDVRVRHHAGLVKSIWRMIDNGISRYLLHEKIDAIPPVVVKELPLSEINPTKNIDLKASEAALFELEGDVVKSYTSDVAVAEIIPAENGFYIWGKKPGTVTAFIWNDCCHMQGLNIRVSENARDAEPAVSPASHEKRDEQNELPRLASHTKLKGNTREVECWALHSKTLWEFPAKPDSPSQFQYGDSVESRAIALNNAGVQALQKEDFRLAISKFLESLKVDRSYKLARANLAIAYNNYGLTLREKPREAIKQFHLALYIDPTNKTTAINIERIIGMTGRDFGRFDDRIEIAEQASAAGDLAGAVIEYKAALNIKDDASQRKQLDEALKKLHAAETNLEPFSILANPEAESNSDARQPSAG